MQTKITFLAFYRGQNWRGEADDFQASGRVRSTRSTALLLPGPVAPSYDAPKVGEGVHCLPGETPVVGFVLSATS